MRCWRFHLGSFLRRIFIATICVSLVACWVIWSQVGTSSDRERSLQQQRTITVSFTAKKCNYPQEKPPRTLENSQSAMKAFLQDKLSRGSQGKVLLVYKHTSIVFRWDITAILGANRISYNVVWVTPKTNFPSLVENDRPKYNVIIFESLKFYSELSMYNRRLIDSYAREFSVGLILFTGQENLLSHHIRDLEIRFKTGITGLKNAELNPMSPILRITRAGGVVEGNLPLEKWVIFESNHSTHEYVQIATHELTSTYLREVNGEETPFETRTTKQAITVMLDKGDLDGIKRIYFGNGVGFWLNRMLFIDALNFMSNGVFGTALDRWFLVDIDDIFVGKAGIRMTKEDVQVTGPILLHHSTFITKFFNVLMFILSF